MADASTTQVGAALHQQRCPSGPREPLRFFSKKLESTQINYSISTGSFWPLSVQSGISGFRWKASPSSSGRTTPPLTFALGCFSDAWTPCQQRQLSYIAEYTSDIMYVPGVDNVVANTLSRPPAVATQPP